MNKATVMRERRKMGKPNIAAREIGPVAVEHEMTGCKTPDASEYITKSFAFRPVSCFTTLPPR